MATGTPDVEQIPEGRETNEECAGKKKSKFQTFKKFFARKKRKESPAPSEEPSLKPSQSSSDVSLPDPANAVFESPAELGAKGGMGNKALSHESVFIAEPMPENTTGDRLSQENIVGKVKALQLQLQSNIRVGSPPQVITYKPCDDAGAMSEDDGLPQSPPEISTLHELLTRSSSKTFNLVEHRSSLSLGGTDSEDEQLSSESSSRAITPLTSSLLPIDFSSPASSLGCLDTSAARHKMALNPRKHRDRIRGVKLMANVTTAGEELPRLAEEEGSTKRLHEVKQPNLGSEGYTALEESASVSRTSEEIDKIDLTVLSEFTSKPASKKADATTLPQFTIKPSSTVAETDTLPELARTPLSNVADTTTLAEVTSKSASEVTENVEEAKESSTENIASGTVSISNSQLSVKHTQDKHYGEEDRRNDEIVPCSSCDLKSESELHPQNVVKDDILLVQTQQESTEPSKCQDQTGFTLNNVGECNEQTIVMDVLEGQDYFSKPADQTKDKPLDINDALVLNVVQPIINAPGATLSIDDAEAQFHPVRSPIENEIVIRDPIQALTPGIESASIKDQELSLVEPQQIPIDGEPQKHSQTSLHADGLDLSTFSNQQAIAIPHDVIGNTTESHDKCNPALMEDLNESRDHDSGAGNDTEKDHDRSICTEGTKTSKAIGENIKSLPKTTKPVKFTIAPAWQRSISGGSSANDDADLKSPPTATIKSELFEGTAKKHEFLDIVRPPAKVVSSIDSSCVNKGASPTPNEQNEKRAEQVEIPFGVRLKKGKIRDLQKSDSSETSVVKDLPKFESPGKSLQTLSDAKKFILKHDVPGDGKDQQNSGAEGVSKKPHPIKTPEKSMSKSVVTGNSEPEWISVAKLKQKCFQGHPLAREQNKPGTSGGATDAEEIQSPTSEGGLRNICVASPVTQGRTSQPLVSTIEAAVGRESEEKSLPAASEKGPRQTAALPVTQQSPAEPPWLSLAKKKAKAWSDMPQIVQ